jgi:hypothetical protein
MTGFYAKSFYEAWITHELRLQNLYRDIAEDNLVVRSPNLTHASNGYAIN